MKYNSCLGEQISVFSLGTAQLGSCYGINNRAGKLSQQRAASVLDCAISLGVTHLDTANDYGDSEAFIGSWINGRDSHNLPLLTTKIGSFDFSNADALRRSVRMQLEESLRLLHLEQLHVLMLHDCDDYLRHPNWMQNVFRELKEEKLIVRSGISVYAYHDYALLADSGFDVVQIPLNIFDWRRIDDGGIRKLANAGIAVFIRSAFLQGIIFRDPEDLEPSLRFCAPTLRQFHSLCAAFDAQPAELAISFLLSLPEISSIVIGCETTQQVQENAALIDRAVPLTAAQMDTVHACFSNVNTKMLNPDEWYR